MNPNTNNASQPKGEINQMIDLLKQCKQLPMNDLRILLAKAKQLLTQQNDMVIVKSPVMVCGDVHGQFYDLQELFLIGGDVPGTSYLFMGDYVDRGHHSVEVISYLLALKVRYPTRITLLRGNHESRLTSMAYGFYDECSKKYGNLQAWKLFMEVFDCLPITALVDNKYFCMHGGLSPSIDSIDQLRTIDRFKQVPTEGPMTDLLWSDPSSTSTGWSINMGRGIAYSFGQDISKSFAHHNGLSCICRAHQLMMNGYEKIHQDTVTTIFSAPNYCYRCGNNAAIMEIDENSERNYISFENAPNHSTEGITQKRVPDYFL